MQSADTEQTSLADGSPGQPTVVSNSTTLMDNQANVAGPTGDSTASGLDTAGQSSTPLPTNTDLAAASPPSSSVPPASPAGAQATQDVSTQDSPTPVGQQSASPTGSGAVGAAGSAVAPGGMLPAEASATSGDAAAWPVRHLWYGGSDVFSNAADWTPNGVPQAGDTAVIPGGAVTVPPGDASGVNFVFRGDPATGAQVLFQTAGSYSVGEISAKGDGSIGVGFGGQRVALSTTGIHLAGGQLRIAEFISGSTFVCQGNSSLTHHASLSMQYVGTASLPFGPFENDGMMKVHASTLDIGQLTGHGGIRATGGSTLKVEISASSDETIQLRSAMLYIGGGPIQSSTAMQFLAPVTHFGAGSGIVLEHTQATSEVFAKSAPNAGELFLYNGSQLVADMHISGQAEIYATNVPNSSAGAGYVLLTAHDTGHALPVPTH